MQSSIRSGLFLFLLCACGDVGVHRDRQEEFEQASSESLASAVVIDDFSTPFSVLHPVLPGNVGVHYDTSPPLQLSVFDLAPAGSIGTRYAAVDVARGAQDSQISVVTHLAFSNGPDPTGSGFVVEYRKFGAIAGAPTGFVRFDVVGSDIYWRRAEDGIPVRIALNGVTRSVSVAPTGTYSIPLSSFTGVDLSRITAIGFSSTAQFSGVDIAFDNLTIDGAFSTCLMSQSRIVVDDFSSAFSVAHPQYPGVLGVDRQNPDLTEPLPIASYDVNPAAVLGNRHASIEVDNTLNDSRFQSVKELYFENGAGLGASRFVLTYDGFPPKAFPKNGVFHFNLVDSDLDNRGLGFSLPADITLNGVTRTIQISKPGVYEIPLSRFVGVNLKRVRSIAFTFAQPQNAPGVDVVFDNFRILATKVGTCGPPPPAPLTVSLLSDAMSVVEGNDDDVVRAVITVVLNRPSDSEVTVDYVTEGDTALPSLDYISPASQTISGTLVFAPGETVKTYTVNIVSDTDPEDDETFFVLLSNPVNAELGIASEVVTIVNDDL